MDGFNLGDLISKIIVFVLYLGVAFSRAKKGKKSAQNRERRSPMRTRAQGEQADRRAAERDRQTRAGFDAAFDHGSQKDGRLVCEKQPIHLHEVSQQQFIDASEGEDPCHAGGAVLQEDSSYEVSDDTNHGMLAQDVLRGVIMSEILKRPHERAAWGRGRR